MTKELEIEFKNMLTKNEYEQLLSYYELEADDVKTQHNYYFDTDDFQLKQKKCALRIRQKQDGYECTLKIPAPDGNYEITDRLGIEDATAMMNGHSFKSPEVLSALHMLEVSPAELLMIGKLTTHRVEFEIDGGLLVLDHSEYGGNEDYEIEFEVADAFSGKKRFFELLAYHGIPVRSADKKIARFMAAAEKRSG